MSISCFRERQREPGKYWRFPSTNFRLDYLDHSHELIFQVYQGQFEPSFPQVLVGAWGEETTLGFTDQSGERGQMVKTGKSQFFKLLGVTLEDDMAIPGFTHPWLQEVSDDPAGFIYNFRERTAKCIEVNLEKITDSRLKEYSRGYYFNLRTQQQLPAVKKALHQLIDQSNDLKKLTNALCLLMPEQTPH